MERLRKQMSANRTAIVNFAANTRKTAKVKQTKGFLQARKLLLEQYWGKFLELHEELLSGSSAADATAAPLQGDDYEDVERAYGETMGELNDLIDSYNGASSTELSMSQAASAHQVLHSLPRIKIPPFDGTFLQWLPFKDLFTSIVIRSTSLTNTQRLQYLKDSLTGEAKHALDNITTTDTNFSIAWDLLQSKFENPRMIVNAHLAAINALPSNQQESAAALRFLLDGSTSSVRALQHLGRPVEQWDDWLVFTLSQKLDPTTRRAWELSLKTMTELPTFKELQEFLTSRTQSLQMVQNVAEVTTQRSKRSGHTHGVAGYHTIAGRCPSCSGNHHLMTCSSFRRQTPQERYTYALRTRLCLNCLRSGHKQVACPSDRRCTICQGKHHSMLHDHFGSTSPSAQPVASHHAVHMQSCNATLPRVLLGTAQVRVRSNRGHTAVLRALLDSGAEATFISEYAVNLLKLPKSRVSIPINGATGNKVATATGVVNFTLCSRTSDFETHCIALVVPRVGNLTPPMNIPSNEFEQFWSLDLADPQFNVTQPIDIILNAGDYAAVLLGGVKRNPGTPLIAQQTQLGWVVFGGFHGHSLTTDTPTVECYHAQVDLDQTLRNFWELEELPMQHSLTEDERYTELHFQRSTRRAEDGRYIVRLPIKENADLAQLATSEANAVAMLDHLQRRLSRDLMMQTMYEKFIEEYLTLQHMEPVADTGCAASPTCYLSHHGVWKESSTTTKLRVVFNASKRCSTGMSLNDCLHTGPKLQNDLTAIILMWRRHRVALTGDIEKMYRQILVDDKDVDLQRIVWRNAGDERPNQFRLKTVTYGVNCAPYLAIKVLHTLADDEQHHYPEAARILRDEFYVDDVLTGADTVEEACRRREQLQNLLKAGGFALRKWNSNAIAVLQTIDPADCESTITHEVCADDESKTLGLIWSTKNDSLTYALNLDYSVRSFTKRQLLSDVAKLFDPLGLLAPIVIRGKMFIQNLWLSGLDWNDLLPDDLQEKWISFRAELKSIAEIKVPRWLRMSREGAEYELHIFADASTHAYAAVAYLKVVTPLSVHINLLMSKTRVAPLKKVTIPRLELCAALLAARILKRVKEILDLHTAPTYLWSDSTTTIWWIRSNPGSLKDFVANRVVQIQDLTRVEDWRYVGTADNPADCASRGLSVTQLQQHRLWWHGPDWLPQPKENWPRTVLTPPVTLSESKRVHISTAQLAVSDWFILENYSTLDKLLAVTAWCKRFAQIALGQPHATEAICLWREREAALNFWVKFVQSKVFKPDITNIKMKATVGKTSKLLRLCPIYEDDILRIGGRLQNAYIPYNERYPSILPSDNHLTILIIRQAHERTLHGGTQATLLFVRRRFWILDGRRTVKRVINNCVRCFRYKCSPQTQLMGNLPVGRCNVSHPFMHTGVDFAGPFNIRTTKGRGYRSYKGYVAVFVCFATRAIHLELVSDMTTEAFTAALNRFVAVRGLCSDIYCDQGTTFVGTAAVMRTELKALQAQLSAAATHASVLGVNWHFIPPGAPHFGGIWEAGVKSMKHHLKRVVHLTTLTFEEMYTVLKQIEACLNSRPLSAMSDDPQDLVALTPGHFLVGRPLTAIAEPSLSTDNVGRMTRWKLLKQIQQDFWRRWSCEYLQQLHYRNKWNQRQPNVLVDQLVLIRDERLPPRCWMLGRIVETHAGEDGAIRVVTVKTQTAVLRRPITKISPLPIAPKGGSLLDTVGGNDPPDPGSD